jgi:hypothetical protein
VRKIVKKGWQRPWLERRRVPSSAGANEMAGRILLDQVLPSVSTQHIKTEPLPELEPSLAATSAFFETV